MRRGTLLTGLIATALLVAAQPAAALSQSVVPTDQTNGVVWAMAHIGNILYFGGSFTEVMDHLGNSVPRTNLAAIDTSTGHVTSWNPSADGAVYAMTQDGTTVFAGGDFKQIGAVPVNRLAPLDPTTGAVRTGWTGSANAPVRALAVRSGVMYVGGEFTKLDGQPHSRIGALNTSTGTVVTAFTASADRTVRAVVLSPDGGRLYIAGYFTSVNSLLRHKIAALDSVSGSALQWMDGSPSTVLALATDGVRLYAGRAGGSEHQGAASYDATTGQLQWLRHANGDVQAIAVLGGEIFFGGHFSYLTEPRVHRRHLAAIFPDGTLDQAWAPYTDQGCTTGGCQAVRVMISIGATSLGVGGDFTTVNGQPQAHVALFT
jgi:hypothetical protein